MALIEARMRSLESDLNRHVEARLKDENIRLET
jgi:hypothetical protein